MNEKIYLPELIETALNISLSSSKNASIKITKEFKPAPLVSVDKSKLLQILINLMQNAKESVLEHTISSIKEIKLIVQKTEKNSVQVIIKDNGVGINRDNLQRIFAFGFTTKKMVMALVCTVRPYQLAKWVAPFWPKARVKAMARNLP